MDDIHIPCIVSFHGDPPPDLSHMVAPIRIPSLFHRRMAHHRDGEHAEFPMALLDTEEFASISGEWLSRRQPRMQARPIRGT